MEEFGVKPEVCEDEPYFTEVLASVMATVCSLLTEILSIQVPSLKVGWGSLFSTVRYFGRVFLYNSINSVFCIQLTVSRSEVRYEL